MKAARIFFDKTDTSLWQKVLDAINSIYKSEEESQQAKRAQQKAKIRQMVIELLISDLSIANIKYITRKEIPIDKFYELIQTFRPIFSVVPLGADVVDRAISLKANDFEDALF